MALLIVWAMLCWGVLLLGGLWLQRAENKKAANPEEGRRPKKKVLHG